MKPFLFITLGLFLAGTGRAQVQITFGPFTNSDNGHIYYSISATNWAESEAYANKLGGHLVTTRSAAENQWLTNTFEPLLPVGSGPLTGLTDHAHEGSFKWISGETNTYRNWKAGEPNNANGNEDYGTIQMDSGKWNDVEGLNKVGIVEVLIPQSTNVPTVSIRLATEIDTSTIEFSWVSATNALYQIQYTTSLESNNWVCLGAYQYGAGATNVVQDTTTNETKKFYRVFPVQ